MSKTWKVVLTSAATIAALSTGTALYAQANKPQSGAGMMMQGQHGDMMMQGQHGDMMAQMNQMMESCNKMMQDMAAAKGTEKPAAKPGAEKSK